MNTGPLSHPGNNPPSSPAPCPVCGGNGYVVETWDRDDAPPSCVRVMACERCNPPRRSLGPEEIWTPPDPVQTATDLPSLHAECPACGGWGAIDGSSVETCRRCKGRGRIPTAAGRAILDFLDVICQETHDWPESEDAPQGSPS